MSDWRRLWELKHGGRGLPIEQLVIVMHSRGFSHWRRIETEGYLSLVMRDQR